MVSRVHNGTVTEPKNYGDALAVVTVTYSPGETLTRFLDTLEKATERDVQVVLADNGSVDGAPERAAAERDNVRFVPTGGNLGYGGGANAGVASLGDDVGWIVIANPDLVERLRNDWPLAEGDSATFYGGGAAGYVDYPAYRAEAEAEPA